MMYYRLPSWHICIVMYCTVDIVRNCTVLLLTVLYCNEVYCTGCECTGYRRGGTIILEHGQTTEISSWTSQEYNLLLKKEKVKDKNWCIKDMMLYGKCGKFDGEWLILTIQFWKFGGKCKKFAGNRKNSPEKRMFGGKWGQIGGK